MKAKYYRIREYLYGNEAVDYLRALTGVLLDKDDFFSIVGNPLPAYVTFAVDWSYKAEVDGNRVAVMPIGLQKVCSSFYLFHGGDLFYQFCSPKAALGTDASYYVELEGAASVDTCFDVDSAGWNGVAKELYKWGIEFGSLGAMGTCLVFLPADIEALADKMNDRPEPEALRIRADSLYDELEELKEEFFAETETGRLMRKRLDSLQDENQRLQQQIEVLKASEKRLKVEGNYSLIAGDANSRKIESLYKLVLGMAIDAYHYDPSKARNNAIGDIERSLDRQGLGMDRKTIKKYLDEARSLFPAKPIDT